MNYLASSGQLRASLLRWSLFTIPLVVALGFLSGQAAGSGPGNPWFDALVKPSIYPPPAAFGIVWTVLYVLMGLALAMVLAARGAAGRGIAVAMFVVQLLINLAWSPTFFALHQITVAFWITVAMAAAIVLTVVLFWRVRRSPGCSCCLIWRGSASLRYLRSSSGVSTPTQMARSAPRRPSAWKSDPLKSDASNSDFPGHLRKGLRRTT